MRVRNRIEAALVSLTEARRGHEMTERRAREKHDERKERGGEDTESEVSS